MRFLLVAPAVGRVTEVAREAVWESVTVPDDATDVEHIERCRIDGSEVLFTIVRTADAFDSVEELELALQTLAQRAADAVPALAELRWVSRVQLAEDAAEAELWPSAHQEVVELRDGGRLTIGWGSGRVEGWTALGAPSRRDVMQGLAQAQALWCALDDLVESSRPDIEQVYTHGSRLNADRSLSRLADVNAQLQLHTLAWGELVRGVRATPRAVARATLDAWDYAPLRSQVDADIRAAMSHAEVLERLAGARYQKAVELVLLALTVVSALGLVIGLVDLSYTVATASPRGSGSPGTLLGAVYSADANVIVLVSGLALLGVLIVLVTSRRSKVGRS